MQIDRADITLAIEEVQTTIAEVKVKHGDAAPLVRYPDGKYVLADMYHTLAMLYTVLAGLDNSPESRWRQYP